MRTDQKCPDHSQAGYLLEVPLLFFLVVLTSALVIPRLPKLAGQGALVAAALIVLGCLYYMIVVPGWRPRPSPLSPRWRLVIFLLVAFAIGFGVVTALV